MRLTSHTDYSLRLLLYLAVHPGEPISVPDVAAAYGLSRHHLAKVSQNLARLGYVETTRGRSGGLTLARPPAGIRVGAVVRGVEPDWALVECLSEGGGCVIAPACRLKGALREARDAFLAVLDGYSLEDLLTNRAHLGALLAITVPARAAPA